jgi:hypothetical protein
MHRTVKILALATLAIIVSGAQEVDSALSRLRKLHLPESAGSVPAIYVPEAEQRALRYRDEVQNARAWLEQELGIQVPMVLAVVDRETYGLLLRSKWPHPGTDLDSTPPLIVFPTRMEEVVGEEPKTKTPGEYITYHEVGHIFAARLNIWSGNAFVNELIANMFGAAYIQERRPDLAWIFDGPPSRFASDPRYTSLADVDYLYAGLSFDNLSWFQYQFQRVAKHLVKDRQFARVAEKLKVEFPAANQKQESLDRIISHFDAIQSGTKAVLGKLAGPTTLASLKPSACPSSATIGFQSYIVFRNNAARPLTVEEPDGAKSIVAPESWRSYQISSGASLRLPDGSCLVAGDEPAVALIAQ